MMDSRPRSLPCRRARGVAALWLGGAALAVATAAWSDPSAQDRETARSLMRDGRELRDGGELTQALARFQAANEIMHVPTTALEVANTQVAMGLLCEARNTIADMRRIPANPDDPLPFQEARTAAIALDATLAKRIPSVTIVVNELGGKPSFLSIDGARMPLAIANLPCKVNPGRHVIVAGTTAGTSRQEIEMREGESKIVRLRLASDIAGGSNSGTPPLQALSSAALPPSHRDTAGLGSTDRPEAVPPRNEASPPPWRTWTYLGAGVGGAALITGTIAGIVAWSQKSSLASECAGLRCGPGQPSDDLDRAKMWATVSTFSFVAAGAAAALVLGSVLLGKEDATSPGSRSGSASTRGHAADSTGWLGIGASGVYGTF